MKLERSGHQSDTLAAQSEESNSVGVFDDTGYGSVYLYDQYSLGTQSSQNTAGTKTRQSVDEHARWLQAARSTLTHWSEDNPY